MLIDITTTATLRPELLEKTYESFTKYLFKKPYDYRVIINIDPVGGNKTVDDVIKVVHRFFPTSKINTPSEPNFAKAWKWCWSQVEADFIFHLEEDWLLLREVDIDIMLSILTNNKDLAALRMMKMNVPTNLNFFRSKYIDKGNFLLSEDNSVAFGGNPQLIKGDFVKQSCVYLREDANPEKQFRKSSDPLWLEVVSKWDYGVYARPRDKQMIMDLGRPWMDQNNFEKNGGAFFLMWKKHK